MKSGILCILLLLLGPKLLVAQLVLTSPNGTILTTGNGLAFMAKSALADVEGNVYNIATIGTQTWMADNLKSTKYNDGTSLPNVTDDNTWSTTTSAAYCYYDNDPSNKDSHGALYNWYAVDNNDASKMASNGGKNICPKGWHVPSDAEWTTLVDYLGTNANGKLKETGLAHWSDPNQGATNESGFTAVPGGFRHFAGFVFFQKNDYLWMWSTTWYGHGGTIRIYSLDYPVSQNMQMERYGLSVRCLKD